MSYCRALPCLALLLSSLLTACGASLVIERPTDRVADAATTAMWADEIRARAQPGDWILARSYSFTGDLIVFGTRGESLSHAAVYDPERDVVIEAVSPRVREISLERMLHRNRYAILVRPSGLSDAQRRATVRRARSAVGRGFDYGGLFGLDDGDRLYCSELAVWAAKLEPHTAVVTPSNLFEYGEVIYVSGMRESEQVQAIALERSLQPHGPRTRVAKR